MEIKEITNRQILDEFIGSQPKSQFLQSWLWGEFQKKVGRDIWRFGVLEGDNLLGSAQVIRHTLPFSKNYLYCPRGPVVDGKLPVEKYQQVWSELFDEIVSRAQKEEAMFVKIEPPIEKAGRRIFDSLTKQYILEPVDFVQPQDSWYLNLSKSEEELMQVMHYKTRYNIRLAERKGVKVRLAENDDDFEKFWQLNLVTGQRDRFRSHSRDYYYQMFNTLRNSGLLKLYLAEYNKEVLAVNFVVLFGDSAAYIHGASSDQHRNVMAPHLLQWRQIQQAKKDGFRYYDFWGVAPGETSEKHPWAGISRFKKGFGGTGISYVGAYDLILNKAWYKLYKLAQKVKYK